MFSSFSSLLPNKVFSYVYLRGEVCGDEGELERPVLVPDLLVEVGQCLEGLRRRRILKTDYEMKSIIN